MDEGRFHAPRSDERVGSFSANAGLGPTGHVIHVQVSLEGEVHDFDA